MNAGFLLPAALLALAAAAPPPDDPARLAWMEGVWVGVSRGVAIEEHWSSPEGGGLIGMHKDSKDGRMVGFEFLRIVPDSGALWYLASPGGAPPTRFRAVELGERRVVFDHPTHDFPQRILYWIDDRGRLNARIEGRVDGRERSQSWVWTRKEPRPEASGGR